MAAGKKKPYEKNTGKPDSERSLRSSAEEQLARFPESSSDLTGQFPEALIHELRVHQIELETQAEELMKAKIALEESRDKYLDLYEFAPLGYLTLTNKALIAEVNLNGATLLGVERGRLVNAPFSKFMSEKDADQWHRYFVNVQTQTTRQSCTLTLLRGDGSMFPARLESIRLTDSEGAITVRVAVSDITDIRQAEEALRESKERYRRITEGLTDYLYTVRVQDGRSVSTTHGAACVVVTGYTAEEFGADPHLWIRMVFDEDRDRVTRHFSGVLKGKRVPPVEHRIVRKDGQIRWVRDTPVLQLDATGMLVSYDGVIKDITERKVAEEALQFTRHSVDSATETLVTIARDGHFADVNNAFCLKSGYSRDELLSMTVQDIDPDYNTEIWSAFWNKLKQSGSLTIETTHHTKEGKTYPVETTLTYFEYNGNEYHCGFARDITERKRAEDALLRVNRKLNILSRLTRKDLTNQIFILGGYLELAKKLAAGQNQIIETIQKSVQAIRLIHETIEYSKDYQDMGAKPPKWQNVKMAMLFGLSHISIGKIQHSLETENLEIFADPLLEKVCQRLFENSVKHGDHVTRIRVWHTATPDEGVTIIFEDDGTGIPQELKEQIFLRSDGPRASIRSLIFVREILDITGITITETGEPGKGARFEMMVPKGAWRMAGKVD